MYKSASILFFVGSIVGLGFSCNQPEKTEKQKNLEAVAIAHKGIIFTAIGADLDSLKSLSASKSDDTNLLNLLRKQNRIAISLAVFVLKSAPDASMQEFALNYVQTTRAFAGRLDALKLGKNGGANIALFDQQKLNAVQTLEIINSLDDVQKDFVLYASANAKAQKSAIESYRNAIKNEQLQTQTTEILSANEAFISRLKDFKSVWQIAE